MSGDGGGSMLRRFFFGEGLLLPRWLRDLDWRFLAFTIPALSLFVFLALTFNPSNASHPFSYSLAPIRSFFLLDGTESHLDPAAPALNSSSPSSAPSPSPAAHVRWPLLSGKRMAVCLVGGARRFELTGPSIVERILKVYPEADLFLNSPYDKNSFKLLLLREAPKIAWVRIFQPTPIPETEPDVRVLTARGSPNGIQGLLQYFNLVEGCLTMIKAYQDQKNFRYDWIVRTRVDGYWSAPLPPRFFIPGIYVIPPGSSYGGLNDRLGIGDMNTSTVALSRISLIRELDAAGLRQLNSETFFRAQLSTHNISYVTKRLPFCIVTDRQYAFPPTQYGVPVAAISSTGPLSGAKCRPCTVACGDNCVKGIMPGLSRGWSWTDWENGTLHLCDAHGEWERGWEGLFDKTAGAKLAAERKRVWSLKLRECVREFEEMRRQSANWEAPAAEEICKLGLGYAR